MKKINAMSQLLQILRREYKRCFEKCKSQYSNDYFQGDESVVTVSLVSSISQHQYKHPFNQASYSGIHY